MPPFSVLLAFHFPPRIQDIAIMKPDLTSVRWVEETCSRTQYCEHKATSKIRDGDESSFNMTIIVTGLTISIMQEVQIIAMR